MNEEDENRLDEELLDLADHIMKTWNPDVHKIRNHLSAHYENGLAEGFRCGFVAGVKTARAFLEAQEDG